MNREIFLLAGEASGDDRGAELIRALRARDPDLKVSGMGGPRMREAGMEILEDVTGQAVVGILEVVKRYPFFKRVFDRLLAECDARRPAAVVGIDYPGFNLRFEKAARRKLGRNSLIMHYISPQLWAWDEKRKYEMARFLDRVLCIFPFEPAIYEGTGLKAEYVGHPLARKILPAPPEGRDSELIALLPGSRKREIKYHWPVFVETAERLRKKNPRLRFAVGDLGSRSFEGFETADPNDLMARAQAGLVASGTATLEACLHGLPIAVVYKVFAPTYWLGKRLIRIPHLAMPNVLAGRPIVPEFIQDRCSAEHLAPALENLLDSAEERGRMAADFAQVRSILGNRDAARNAADSILRTPG